MKENVNKLNFAVVPQDFLLKIESEIGELRELLRVKNDEEINTRWIESVEVPKILGISRKTWQTYRDRRLIPFSQIGSKIYVKRSDLENFMNSHYIKSSSPTNKK